MICYCLALVKGTLELVWWLPKEKKPLPNIKVSVAPPGQQRSSWDQLQHTNDTMVGDTSTSRGSVENVESIESIESVECVVWTSDWSHPGDPATQCRPATQATPPQYDTLSLKIDFSAGVRWPFRHHHYRLVFSWIASSKWVLGPRVLQQLSWSSYTSSVSVGVKNIE